ncbi:hypothetical protein GGS20DRAFT_430701 [Poronia punctata]|nr:hypothetical protein GGS20DRAFT_430701 [Poronia punctata]
MTPVAWESRTVSPLPPVVRTGSIAIIVFALLSFTSALALFVYLTHKVVRWQLWGPGASSGKGQRRGGYRFEMGSVEFGPAHDVAKLASSEPAIDAISLAATDVERRSRYPNQFIVLIVNLLIADLHQATAFALSTSWLVRDGIMVETGTCFAQGLFVSVGDLASSCFMSAIAIHTFYSIVYGYRPPHKRLHIYIGLIWAFVYLISLLPVAGTLNGASMGGFYVRAGAWCWINGSYGNIRLLTHYIFIFIAIILSWVLYAAIFISLRRQHRRGSIPDETSTRYHHPAFLIYPIIYLICILPLAIGRVATMAGKAPPLGYFCFAGCLVASNGWLDVILFTTTRRSIVFAQGDELGNEDTGVETFTFSYPAPKKFGNTTWVRGGSGHHHHEQDQEQKSSWWGWSMDPEKQARKHAKKLGKSLSQTSLAPTPSFDPNAIQMEVVTTVVVEEDMRRARGGQSQRDFSDSTSSTY